ncbi:MAG: hypothetical protein IJS03_08655, partial [Eubacterium sp.]|nr:hypothetical protein [Eubacterium sp.]
ENNSYTVINGGNFTGGSSFVRANSGATTEVNDGNFACLGTESESNWIVNGGNVNAITVDENTEDISITVNGGEIKALPSTSIVSQATNVTVEVSGGSFDSVVPEAYCADGYVPVTEPNEQGKYSVHQGEANNGVNITIEDSISENFYLDDDFYGEGAYVAVNYNHNSDVSEQPEFKTDVKAMASLDDYTDGRKKFSVDQAPAQSTEPITINIYASQADAEAGINPVDTITYSVYSYCREIIQTSNDAELVELAESTLDYAATAQTLFGYNTDDMATKDVAGFYNNVDGADLTDVAGFASLPSCVTSATMVVKSDLEINLLANREVVVEGATIDADGSGSFGVTTPGWNGDYYVIHISGIEAEDMDANITIHTDAGEIEFTANTIMKVFAASDNANLAMLAKAMYLYGQAANNYFD